MNVYFLFHISTNILPYHQTSEPFFGAAGAVVKLLQTMTQDPCGGLIAATLKELSWLRGLLR